MLSDHEQRVLREMDRGRAAGTMRCLWWRYWRLLRDDGGIGIPPTQAEDPGPASPRRPGGRWLTRYLERISEVE